MTQNCGEKKETCHIFYIMKLEGGKNKTKQKKKTLNHPSIGSLL
jgi:hypothetical protein